MKEFVLVISMWGNNGTAWEYIGNQYVMNEKFTEAQCEILVDNSNWKRHIINAVSYTHLTLPTKRIV